jgi:hypothetical protein
MEQKQEGKQAPDHHKQNEKSGKTWTNVSAGGVVDDLAGVIDPYIHGSHAW